MKLLQIHNIRTLGHALTLDLFSDCTRSGGETYINYIVDSLVHSEVEEEKYEDIVGNLVRQSIDDAERLLRSWLVLDEKQMKQIGLQKLDIHFTCDLKPYLGEVRSEYCMVSVEHPHIDRLELIFDQMIDEWVKARIDYWNECGRQCIKSTEFAKQGYEITFSLQM